MSSEQQVEALWGTLSHAVEESIRKAGGFAPVGAVMYPDSRIETVIAASWADAQALLEDEVRRRVASGCVATVRATHVQAQVAESPEPLDGILVRFDNDAGVSQANFMAYTVENGQISYGDLHGQEGAHDLFSPAGH